MASDQTTGQETEQQAGNDHGALGLMERIEDRYKKLKEHAETYPYVWASYIVVYGGLGLWTAYRWRKLRKTEDRVRALQERLRKLVESEESAASSSASSSIQKAPSAEKPQQGSKDAL